MKKMGKKILFIILIVIILTMSLCVNVKFYMGNTLDSSQKSQQNPFEKEEYLLSQSGKSACAAGLGNIDK